MPLPIFQRTIVTQSGDVLPGASVEVRRESDNALVQLYADRAGTVLLPNPTTADNDGFVQFFTGSSNYRITATSSEGTVVWRYVDIGSADVRTDLAASTGAGLVGFVQTGSGAVPRTTQSKLREIVSVQDFGAVGDGVADDTVAIQSAVNYLNSLGGGRLYLPRGVYLTNRITVYSNLWLVGDGRTNTTIRLRNGANTDVIYSDNANGLWGTNSGGGIQNFGLFDLTIDGNRSNNLVGGTGISLYGDEFYFQNLSVTNTRDQGIRTEWGRGDSVFGMESHYANVRIDSTGKEGWWNNGPHDSVTVNLIIIDGSMNASNTYDGLRIGPSMTGRFIGCHVWNRAASNRHRWALYLEPGGGGNDFVSCHFEGAWSGNAGIFCTKNTFDPTCWFYSAWNGTNVYLGGVATLNTIRGRLDSPGQGRPASVGVALGGEPGDFVSDNVVDVYSLDQQAGVISFVNSDGNNYVTVRGFQIGGVLRVGNPNTRDVFDFRINTENGPVTLNNQTQTASISVAANSTATWTFPFAFDSTPNVVFSPFAPSGNITSGIWISNLNATSVTIFNNNPVSMTLNIVARQFA